MGVHFDGLVELVKNNIRSTECATNDMGLTAIPSIKAYLEGLITKTKLFDFPILAQNIAPKLDLEKEAYGKYIDDYLDLSSRFGRHLITPFKSVSIEDAESVVFFENLKGNNYRVTIYNDPSFKRFSLPSGLLIGDILIGKPDIHQFPCKVDFLYSNLQKDGRKVYIPSNMSGGTIVSSDLVRGAVSFIDQLVYIMDPANFIVEKESNASKKQTEKEMSRKSGILRKTINRPHYICLSEQDIKSFLQNESNEAYSAHPVIGYYKTLSSPRWKNKQGQEIFVGQYWTGDAEIIGRNGWNYRVFIKTAPDKVVPYTKAKEMKKR